MKETLLTAARGLVLAVLALAGSTALFTLEAVSITYVVLGVGVFTTPLVLTMVRRYANRRRRLMRDWFGVEIPEPYRPMPELLGGVTGVLQRFQWMIRDPATWRDMWWLFADMTAGCVPAVLPAGLVIQGVYGIALAAGVWRPIADHGGDWYTFIYVHSQGDANRAAMVGVVLIGLGFLLAKPIMKVYARMTHALLAPSPASALTRRVARLTETRSEALDSQAAELRRIERDLHDGAQARLVAVGLSLGAIEHLMEHDPERARALLAEARKSSAEALDELRDLVRGIHPPVLAERGLGDAVRALALRSPLNVEVAVELPGRLDSPVESASYFAVSELLTNAAKHSGARRVWVDLRYSDGVLRFIVNDDGHGGADPALGSGLAGIERRLAAFDGLLAVSSPSGGPTIVTVELPCGISIPG